MTVAFANGGNRDAALLRVEPALWGRRNQQPPGWIPLIEKVHPNIPVTAPKTPTVVRAGGVEMVTLSARLAPRSPNRPSRRRRAAPSSASASRR